MEYIIIGLLVIVILFLAFLLITIKNRLCCPKDNEPLITILEKKVTTYELKITCNSCESIYCKTK